MKNFKLLSPKRKFVFIVSFAFTLFCLWFIFSHSAKTAVESTKQSGGFVDFFTKLLNDVFGSSLTETDVVGPVRTLAHITEFGFLAFTSSISIEALFEKKKLYFKIIPPFIVTIASIDEIVQIFFEGRAFQFTDILFDTTGGILGILFLYLVLKIMYRKSES
jgi:VanZ family protein